MKGEFPHVFTRPLFEQRLVTHCVQSRKQTKIPILEKVLVRVVVGVGHAPVTSAESTEIEAGLERVGEPDPLNQAAAGPILRQDR